VLHSGAGEQDELELRVAVANDTLRVTVIDHGRGFDPPKPTGGDESGWGLYIVDRLSHAWGVEREPDTAVWFEMRAGAEAEAERSDEQTRGAGAGQGEEAAGRRSAFSRLRPGTSAA
jgi:anti-sigma regulatory factor (Ser/Thr protein kinase)